MYQNKIIDGRPIILIGAGQLAHLTLAMWPPFLDKPIMILDEFSNLKDLNGIPIVKTSNHIPESHIQYLLSAFKIDLRYIKNLFFNFLNQDILTVYDLLTQYNYDTFSNGWQGSPLNIDNAEENTHYFTDSKSKQIYSSVIKWRYFRILEDNVLGDEKDKYKLHNNEVKNLNYDLIIDGGSFDLSFVESLILDKVTCDKIIIVEPDKKRFEIIRKDFELKEKYKMISQNFGFVQKALWRTNTSVPFYQNSLLSARIANNPRGTFSQIDSITLEKILHDNLIEFDSKVLVKLHIEGAEWPVIKSSIKTISKFTNIDFLVNLSHDEQSLIEIPKAFSNLGYYHLLLHSHAHFGEGLTLLAQRKK